MAGGTLEIPDGLYRLVKWQEDGNPVFPSNDTVVEVRGDRVINLSTGRSWPLAALGEERSLFGPLRGPYDSRRLKNLQRLDLARPAGSDIREMTALPHAG